MELWSFTTGNEQCCYMLKFHRLSTHARLALMKMMIFYRPGKIQMWLMPTQDARAMVIQLMSAKLELWYINFFCFGSNTLFAKA